VEKEITQFYNWLEKQKIKIGSEPLMGVVDKFVIAEFKFDNMSEEDGFAYELALEILDRERNNGKPWLLLA